MIPADCTLTLKINLSSKQNISRGSNEVVAQII